MAGGLAVTAAGEEEEEEEKGDPSDSQVAICAVDNRPEID